MLYFLDKTFRNCYLITNGKNKINNFSSILDEKEILVFKKLNYKGKKWNSTKILFIATILF